jgi:DNA-binding CsgD family transcriptional regulator
LAGESAYTLAVPRSLTMLPRLESERPMLELQTAVELDEFWRATKRLLSAVIPHHSCSLMLGIVDYEPLEGRHHVAVSQDRGNRPLNSLSIAKPYLAAHPHLKLYTYGDIEKADPQAWRRRKEREKHFWGWDQFVHLAFWDGDRPDAVLSVRRTHEQGDFSEVEREFLGFLHPTLDAGLRRLRKLHRERERGAAVETYLRALPMPVVFVEADGRVGFATQQAYELCAIWNYGERDGRLLKARKSFRLPPAIARACNGLFSGLGPPDGALDLSAGAGVRIVHPEMPGLSAKIDPAQTLRGPWGRPGFWVTFTRAEESLGPRSIRRAETAAALQQLSPSERRVALLVAAGKRNLEVAQQLGKSLRTVEFQLNAIYRKLALSGRTQLVRALS